MLDLPLVIGVEVGTTQLNDSVNQKGRLMRTSPVRSGLVAAAVGALLLSGCATSNQSPSSGGEQAASGDESGYITRSVSDGKTAFTQVVNPEGGPTLSYSDQSKIGLIEEIVDGKTMAFKDVDGDGSLQVFEDWRRPAGERAESLAEQLTLEDMAGLMLVGPHERSISDGLTDAQKEYLKEGHLRTILHAGANGLEDSVKWSNEIQAYVEELSEGDAYIPVMIASDPRSDAVDSYTGAEGGDLSAWPGNLGLAALTDPERTLEFAQVTSEEYRAIGITYALAPQIDLASDPRWLRLNGTFGQNSELAAELAEAYVSGYQNTFNAEGEPEGWGNGSVATVIKHFAGDGASEGGRGSHTDTGKYTVFPGDNWDEHLVPFQAAIDSAGVMTAYSIPIGPDGKALFEDIGTAYDASRIGILRSDMDYDGVIFTDWNVMKHPEDPDNPLGGWGEAWGAQDMSLAERFYTVMAAGVDVYGGESEMQPVLDAADLWNQEYEAGNLDVNAETRMRESAVRVLTPVFETGVYDNPFLDLERSQEIAGDAEKVAAGWDAQVDSVVVLKNSNDTIQCDAEKDWSELTAYIPRAYDTGFDSAFGPAATEEYAGVNIEAAESIFGTVVTDEVVMDEEGNVTEYNTPDLSEVDIVLAGLNGPNNGNLASGAGRDPETGEWYPLSLQYGPYTADSDSVRKVSLSGDTLEDGTKENRSYFGATSRISNESELESFDRAVEVVRASGKDIPIVTIVKAKNPLIPAEFERDSDAIVAGFGVSDLALINVALGLSESAGKLPVSFPANMETVEASYEDVPGDYEAYVDTDGNVYEFGYGLTCSGSLD